MAPYFMKSATFTAEDAWCVRQMATSDLRMALADKRINQGARAEANAELALRPTDAA